MNSKQEPMVSKTERIKNVIGIAIVILVLEIKKPRFSKEIILQLFRRMRTQQ